MKHNKEKGEQRSVLVNVMIERSELTSPFVKVPFFWVGTPCRLEIHLPTIRRSIVTYLRGQAVQPERT